MMKITPVVFIKNMSSHSLYLKTPNTYNKQPFVKKVNYLYMCKTDHKLPHMESSEL